MTTENTLATPNQNAAGSHTFVLKVTDKPGAMELVAAAFAQRGVSLSTSLGTDSAFTENGHGKLLLTFTATPAKKEVLRRALQRLSRVQSLEEYAADAPELRKTALLRLAQGAPDSLSLPDNCGWCEKIARDENSGETTFLVAGTALAVDDLLRDLRAQHHLLDVTQTMLAL